MLNKASSEIVSLLTYQPKNGRLVVPSCPDARGRGTAAARFARTVHRVALRDRMARHAKRYDAPVNSRSAISSLDEGCQRKTMARSMRRIIASILVMAIQHRRSVLVGNGPGSAPVNIFPSSWMTPRSRSRSAPRSFRPDAVGVNGNWCGTGPRNVREGENECPVFPDRRHTGCARSDAQGRAAPFLLRVNCPGFTGE